MRSTTIFSAAVIAVSVAPALGFQFERRVRRHDEGELFARDEQDGRHGRGHKIDRQPLPRPPAGHVRRPAPNHGGPRPMGRRDVDHEVLLSRDEEDTRHGRGKKIDRQPMPAPPAGHVRRPPPRARELDDEGLFARAYEGVEVYARDFWSWISPRLVGGQASTSSPRELDGNVFARSFDEDDLFARMDWEMDELD